MTRLIDPTPQFLDDAGDPLVSGKLYFYESDTTTPKTTYADVNLSIANANPVLLTGSGRAPNIFFDGSASVILTKSDDTQVWQKDPVSAGDITSNFSDWNPLVSYTLGAIVQGSDNKNYRSLQTNNLGNDPTLAGNTSFWEEVDFVTVWNKFVTYDLNATVRGSTGLFYRSLVANNLGNDPLTNPTQWGSPVAISFDPIAPYSDTLVAVPLLDIDLANGNYFTKTLTANSTLTFSNALTNASSFTLHVLAGTSYTITWPVSVTKWKDGAAPTLTDDDLLVFITEDSGVSYTGIYVGAVAAI